MDTVQGAVLQNVSNSELITSVYRDETENALKPYLGRRLAFQLESLAAYAWTQVTVVVLLPGDF